MIVLAGSSRPPRGVRSRMKTTAKPRKSASQALSMRSMLILIERMRQQILEARVHRPQSDFPVVIEYPDPPVGIISQQLVILAAGHRMRPHDARLIYIRIIVHPFVVNQVVRAISN